jgi:hypothetical protein
VVAWQARWRAVADELARQQVEADPPGVAGGGVRAADGVRCPYPGMAPFGPEDAALFRGRQKLITEVVTKLAVQIRSGGGPLVVVGPSGVGKSSLLRAGVLPALAAGEAPVAGGAGWPQVYLRPGADPLGELATHLDALGIGEPGLAAAIRADPAALRRALRRADEQAALGEAPVQATPPTAAGPLADRRMVIVVDQLEELFTHGSSEADRVALVRADLEPGQVDQGLAHVHVISGPPSGVKGRLEVAPGRCEVAGLLVRESEVVQDAAADLLRISIALVEERQRLLEPSDRVDDASLPTQHPCLGSERFRRE